jgi:NAD(P)-dependent dehydrogenase (short-subunit alcohol dehydrogenase family)
VSAGAKVRDTIGAMQEFRGRVAVVTGAASGIGLALTEAFVAEGMKVLMGDIDGTAVEAQAQRIGDSVASVVVDVRDQTSVQRAGDQAMEVFGGLHVAVNNAGVVNGGNSWELSLEEWHRVLDTNLWGVIHGVRAFVPLLLISGEEGYVVNTASMAAVLPVKGIAPYTVAKHGVLGLSDVLRAEFEALGAPIGVSVVMPGMIRTGMNPIGTVEPSTVAANVLDAMRRNRPYVFTDDHHAPQVEARLDAIRRARSDVLPSP